jgi:hypothetical protein
VSNERRFMGLLFCRPITRRLPVDLSVAREFDA